MWYGAILSVLCPTHTPTCVLSSPMPCPDPDPEGPPKTDGNAAPTPCAAPVEPGSSGETPLPAVALSGVSALPWPPPSLGVDLGVKKESVPVAVVAVVVVAVVGLPVLAFSSSLLMLLSPLVVAVGVVVRVSPVVIDSRPLSQSGWCWSSTTRWISYRVIGSPFPRMIFVVFRAHEHKKTYLYECARFGRVCFINCVFGVGSTKCGHRRLMRSILAFFLFRKHDHDTVNTRPHSRKRLPFSYLGGIQPTVMLLGVADTMFTACGGADGGATRVRSSASLEATP